ncbi:hypothetical protein CP533_3483 [Ophiocordyceps camponoti-saundersi (nom. inval.)]|nr:hypothetical protein CP533_3483 [Ophiocordyceps camponoti-saundersi (nom. inval.)]
MAESNYTVYVRVPIPRGQFVDPPQGRRPVEDPLGSFPNRDRLWVLCEPLNAFDALLTAIQGIRCSYFPVRGREALILTLRSALGFQVPVDFLLQQVAYLTDRHASQVRAQVLKATAAARGSAAPSPVPPGSDHPRTTSALSVKRDSPLPRHDGGFVSRPAGSRNTSVHAASARDASGSSAMLPVSSAPTDRLRLSSLPLQPSPAAVAEQRRAVTPGPAMGSLLDDDDDDDNDDADDDDDDDDDDGSSPAQSRIIRRPPRFQQAEAAQPFSGAGDGDSEEGSEPAFQPYQPAASEGQDLASTLKGDGRIVVDRGHQGSRKDATLQSHLSDSSAGSGANAPRPARPREPKTAGHGSPRRTAELSGRGKGKAISHEGSDGTPSMGSSYSDLDDASVTQSAMEEVLASHMNRGAISSRFSISQAFRSRYFINDEDEIRNIEQPDTYFKFFLDHNERINLRQRFSFDHAMEEIVHDRLEKLGMRKLRLPLGAKAEERHVPIMVSADIETKSHVVVIFGEPCQELGVLAKRVMNGRGGLEKGSMISVVRALQKQTPEPGIILANTGQLFWWPEGSRSLTVIASQALPLPSLAHRGYRFVAGINDVPGNESPANHIGYVCRRVIDTVVKPDASISVVAIGQSCELMMQYLDDAENWSAWEDRLKSMLLLGHVYADDYLVNSALKDFLAKRTRAYVVSDMPLDMPLAPPTGNEAESIPSLGCPCYSSSEPCHTEVILIRALDSALSYLQAAATPDFENPTIVALKRPEEPMEDDWDKVPEELKPAISIRTGAKMAKHNTTTV